jgi:hypothetical protein
MLEEYILRVELGGDIREIVVEGVVDRDLVDRALNTWGCEANVLEADFLLIDREEIEGAGFRAGVKGKLLTLARALAGSSAAAELAERMAVVVDRDHDTNPAPNPFLFLTDGFAIESYALNPNALHRFVEQVLGRAPRVAGADGAATERHSCTGSELYGALHQSLIELAGIRLALAAADPSTRPSSGWLDYVVVDDQGRATTDGSELLRNLLTTWGRGGEIEALEEIRVGACEVAQADPQRWIRGRDFLAVLSKILNSPWGRRRNGRAATGGDQNQLARFLLFSVDPDELHSSTLFAGLRERFCAA